MNEQQQFESTCKGLFNELKQGQNELRKDQKEILDRLFKDNGHKSVQTCLNDVEKWQENHDKNDKGKFVNSGVSMTWLICNWHKIVISFIALIWALSSTISVIRGTPVEQIIQKIQQIQETAK